jgi:hypothetical protein
VAEADMSSQDSRASQMHFTRLQDDGFVQRQMLELIVFTEENTQQYGIVRKLHHNYPPCHI